MRLRISATAQEEVFLQGFNYKVLLYRFIIINVITNIIFVVVEIKTGVYFRSTNNTLFIPQFVADNSHTEETR